MNPSVAIIGSGYAGLAAAISLIDQGIAVTIFDHSTQPGGRARIMERRTPALDQGQHILLGAYENLLTLMGKVGVNIDTALLRLPLLIHVPHALQLHASLRKAPWHLLSALATAKGVTLRRRWSLARIMSHARTAQPKGTVREWLQSQGQDSYLQQHLWDPLCFSALNTSPEEADARVLVTILQRSLLSANCHHSDLLLPRVGLDALFPAPALDYLRRGGAVTHLGTRILSIKSAEDFFLLNDMQHEPYTHVIVAVAPWSLSALANNLPLLAPQVLQAESLASRSIVTGFFRYAHPLSMPAPLIGLSHHSTEPPIPAPPAPHWVFDLEHLRGWSGWVAMVSSAAEGIPSADDWQRVLAHHIGPLPDRQDFYFHYSRKATFACLPQTERPSCHTPYRQLFLCGDYTIADYPGTLESAVMSGQEAARALLSTLR